ncbi:MAG: hypothetical protein ACXADS_02590 [Candidatus Thorarchaeota archaeon]|jgi:hypothetical protein
MTDVSEMTKKYAGLVEAPVDESTVNENGESLSTLCQSEWVRILVIRRPSTPETVTIEVEISLPYPVVHSSAADDSDSEVESSADTIDLLQQAIEHLHYLSRLRNNGFTLDVVGQECLWTAFRDFREIPRPDVFELLSPPSGCGQRAQRNPSVIPPFRYTI